MDGIIGWFTGRNPKESDVYLDEEKVDQVLSSLKKIETGEVESAREAIYEAINNLNNVNGVAQYVGCIEVSHYEEVFESITASIEEVSNKIQSKSDDIKTYNNASGLEKIGSSIAMAGAKFGEGFLSVFEGIGDAAVSVVGWVAPKDSGVEKWCTSFVEKNWSHDAFNFYYKSDFAKKSAFTEDSGIAGAFKLVGETTGYLALGGAISGVSKGAGLTAKASGSVFGGGAKAGAKKLGAKALNATVGTSTRVNTTLAVATGLGNATEQGIQSGMSLDEAFVKKGLTQATIQGVTAYGFGKLGEKSMKNKAIAENQQIIDKADEVLKAKKEADLAVQKFKQARSTGASQDTLNNLRSSAIDKMKKFQDLSNDFPVNSTGVGSKTAAINQAKKDAEAAMPILKDRKLSSFDGYHDSISNKYRSKGENFVKKVSAEKASSGNGTIKSSVKVFSNKVKDTATSFKTKTRSALGDSTGKITPKSMVTNAGTKIKENAKTTFKNDAGKVTPKTAITGTVKTVTAPVRKIAKPVTSTVKSVAAAGKDNIVYGAGSKIGKVAVATAGVVAPATAIKHERSNAQFRSSKVDVNIVHPEDGTNINENVDYSVNKKAKVSGTNPSSSSTGGSSAPSTGGGSSSNGSGSSSYGGGGSYTAPTGTPTANNSNEQFKAQVVERKQKKDVLIDKGESKTPTKTPSKPTTPIKPNTDNITPKPPTNDTPTNTITPQKPTPNNSNNTPSNPTTTVTVTPTNNGGGSVQHTGGGYSGTGGYRSYSEDTVNEGVTTSPIESIVEDTRTSIDDIVKGSKYTKIPTSSKPISTTSSSGSGGSAVIPVVAGLSAAAAAGVGAKVYMDRKKNDDNGEEDEINTEEWNGDDTINLDYDDSSDTQAYLDDDDDYGYQEEQPEKYDARNNEELADLQ